MPQQPIGRVVHYVSRGSADGRFHPACRAAVVTEVDPNVDGLVGLAVLNPVTDLSYPGASWHRPERV